MQPLKSLTSYSPNEILDYLSKSVMPIINKFIGTKTVQVLVDATVIKWDVNGGYNASVVLGGNRALSIISLEAGDYGTLQVKQDASGSRTLTLPSGSIVMGTQGGSTLTLSSGINYIDIITFYYDGINLFWNKSLY